MLKRPGKSEKQDNGLTRLYQAWASLPWFDHEHGEWYHARSGPIGNPRTSAKACQKDVDEWLARNREKVDALNAEVAKSNWDGSEDIRVITAVYQIWPMTERSPWMTGMFDWVEDLSTL